MFIHMNTWILGKDSVKRHCQTWKNSEQFDNGRHHGFWLQACKKSLGRLQGTEFRHVSLSVCAEQYATISRCIWKLPQQMHWNILTLSWINFVTTRVSMANISEENRNRNGVIDIFWFDTNGRERHLRWNVSYTSSIRKSQWTIIT